MKMWGFLAFAGLWPLQLFLTGVQRDATGGAHATIFKIFTFVVYILMPAFAADYCAQQIRDGTAETIFDVDHVQFGYAFIDNGPGSILSLFVSWVLKALSVVCLSMAKEFDGIRRLLGISAETLIWLELGWLLYSVEKLFGPSLFLVVFRLAFHAVLTFTVAYGIHKLAKLFMVWLGGEMTDTMRVTMSSCFRHSLYYVLRTSILLRSLLQISTKSMRILVVSSFAFSLLEWQSFAPKCSWQPFSHKTNLASSVVQEGGRLPLETLCNLTLSFCLTGWICVPQILFHLASEFMVFGILSASPSESITYKMVVELTHCAACGGMAYKILHFGNHNRAWLPLSQLVTFGLVTVELMWLVQALNHDSLQENVEG